MDYNILKNIIDNQLVIFDKISDDEWRNKFSPDKWSKKEILGHLCDSAFTNIRRFIVTQYKENENIVYDQNFWVKAQNYQNIPVQNIINLWISLNFQLINIFENIPEELLNSICDTSKIEKQSFTLKFLIDDYINHLNHHLKVINNDKI